MRVQVVDGRGELLGPPQDARQRHARGATGGDHLVQRGALDPVHDEHETVALEEVLAHDR